MKKLTEFLGLTGDFPKEERMWYGFDSASKIKIALISLISAFFVLVFSLIIANALGRTSNIIPWALAAATFLFVITTTKNRHLERKE